MYHLSHTYCNVLFQYINFTETYCFLRLLEFQKQNNSNKDDDISDDAFIEALYKVEMLEIIYGILDNIDYNDGYTQGVKRIKLI